MRLMTNLFVLALVVAPALVLAGPGDTALFRQARGDVNLDGRLDIADITLLTHYLNGGARPSRSSLEAMDINRDGRVDIADLTVLVHLIFGPGDVRAAHEKCTALLSERG